MKLIPYDIKKLARSKRKYTDNYKVLMEFRNSDADCVKVTGWTHVTASSCVASLSKSIQTYKMQDIIQCMRCGEDIYLIKIKDEH